MAFYSREVWYCRDMGIRKTVLKIPYWHLARAVMEKHVATGVMTQVPFGPC